VKHAILASAQFAHEWKVEDAALDEASAVRDPLALAEGEVIDDIHFVAARQKQFGDVTSDEPGSAGY
jgi:hypothetical protein